MAQRRYALLALAVAATFHAAPARATEGESTISVYGGGSVSVKPDVAFVTLHVQGTGLLMEDAFRDATNKTAAITKAIREKHSEVRSIEQATVEIKQRASEIWGPGREAEPPQPAAVLRLRVEIPPDQALAVAVVDTAIRNGASLIDPAREQWVGASSGAVLYGLEDWQAAATEALGKAFAQARSSAEQVAAAAGMKVGEISTVGCTGPSHGAATFNYGPTESLPVAYSSSDPAAVEVTQSVCVTYRLLAMSPSSDR